MAEADALALLAIARRDLLAAQGMTDTTTFHESVWGLQMQQTIEKALKAWLYLSAVEPAFTQDLVALVMLLERRNRYQPFPRSGPLHRLRRADPLRPCRSTGDRTRSRRITTSPPRAAIERCSRCFTLAGLAAGCLGVVVAGAVATAWILPAEDAHANPQLRS